MTWVRGFEQLRVDACCGFMTVTVTVVDNGLRREATTVDDPMTHAVLQLMVELPESVGEGAGALHERFSQDAGVPIVNRGAVVEADGFATAIGSTAIPTE